MRARCAVASEGHVRVNVAYLQRTHVDAHVCIGELPSPEECMHGKICPFVDHRLYYNAVIAKLECAALYVHINDSQRSFLRVEDSKISLARCYVRFHSILGVSSIRSSLF